jgi:23S rRNA pseudouridine2605 synthase
MRERLQKILARAGVASRRGAEDLMRQGRVRVNGEQVRQMGTQADASVDRIEVDGREIPPPEPRGYYALFKPAGVVSTLDDPQRRRSVGDLLSDIPLRVFPVGRLDFDAEGLLLATNDGELADKLMHPSSSVVRLYQVKVAGRPSPETLAELERGVFLHDGKARAVVAQVIRYVERNTWIELGLTEGRNHEVKRMCHAVGHSVRKLRRVAYGPVRLGDLEEGCWRELTADEVAALQDQVAESSRGSAGQGRKRGRGRGQGRGRGRR